MVIKAIEVQVTQNARKTLNNYQTHNNDIIIKHTEG